LKHTYNIPSRELKYSDMGKRKIIFKSAFLGGYVGSLEGTVLRDLPCRIKSKLNRDEGVNAVEPKNFGGNIQMSSPEAQEVCQGRCVPTWSPVICLESLLELWAWVKFARSIMDNILQQQPGQPLCHKGNTSLLQMPWSEGWTSHADSLSQRWYVKTWWSDFWLQRMLWGTRSFCWLRCTFWQRSSTSSLCYMWLKDLDLNSLGQWCGFFEISGD